VLVAGRWKDNLRRRQFLLRSWTYIGLSTGSFERKLIFTGIARADWGSMLSPDRTAWPKARGFLASPKFNGERVVGINADQKNCV
jgi:hypothetical protein